MKQFAKFTLRPLYPSRLPCRGGYDSRAGLSVVVKIKYGNNSVGLSQARNLAEWRLILLVCKAAR